MSCSSSLAAFSKHFIIIARVRYIGHRNNSWVVCFTGFMSTGRSCGQVVV